MRKRPKITRNLRWVYGFGAIAYGVKENGMGYLLLFYYSQVLGLSATLAGLALFVALLFDAISDPLVGYWSDRVQSRWGRRLPFMYASIFPIGIFFYLLWNPPVAHLSEMGLFLYLLLAVIGVRLGITLYEIPSTALVPEFTDDYDERTRLLSLRYMFGWVGGAGIALLAWGVFLRATEEYAFGVMNPVGYQNYGIAATLTILLSILVSTVGIHKYSSSAQVRFHAAANARPAGKTLLRSLRTVFRELGETLGQRDFLVLVVASVFNSVAWGMSTAFDSYINTFFWGFPSEKVFWVYAVMMGSALLAGFCSPALAERYGKKRAAIGLYATFMIIAPLLVTLRSVGILPGNDWPLLFPVVLSSVGVAMTIYVMQGIMQSSMLADVVEQSEEKTGRREEALFFSTRMLSQKASVGLGAFAVGVILDLIQFPENVTPSQVPESVLHDLGLVFICSVVAMPMLAILTLSFYRNTKAQHDRRVARLRASES